MAIAKEGKVGACTRQERIPLTTKKMNLYPFLSHISFATSFDKTSATAFARPIQLENAKTQTNERECKLKSLRNYYLQT